jgi:hypothetical protein
MEILIICPSISSTLSIKSETFPEELTKASSKISGAKTFGNKEIFCALSSAMILYLLSSPIICAIAIFQNSILLTLLALILALIFLLGIYSNSCTNLEFLIRLFRG